MGTGAWGHVGGVKREWAKVWGAESPRPAGPSLTHGFRAHPQRGAASATPRTGRLLGHVLPKAGGSTHQLRNAVCGTCGSVMANASAPRANSTHARGKIEHEPQFIRQRRLLRLGTGV